MTEQLSRADFIQTALHHRSWGWSVIPTNGKKAAAGWKQFQTRRPNDREIDWLFRRIKMDGIAVILGRISGGLACRDFDTEESYLAWAKRNPRMARELPTVKTARGYHVYFRMTYETFATIGDGELRAAAGFYCIIPPSPHPSGTTYRWLNGFPSGPSAFQILDPSKAGFAPAISLPEIPQKKAGREDQDKAQKNENRDADSNTSCVNFSSPLIWQAVWRTLPRGGGQRHRRLFSLARHLKSIPELAALPASALNGIVRRWHLLASGAIETREWAVTWKDFQEAWIRVKSPIGSGFLENLMVTVTAGIDNPDARLLAVCQLLQDVAGNRPFFLSARSAQRWAAYGNHMTASLRLKALVKAGVLTLVKPGTGGTMQRDAAEYRLC